jgi:ribonuclease G
VKREIVINASALEARVALLEDGTLGEFYLERQQRQGLVGNIYKGKVTRVLPGMQAAFVDIGLDKAGFLHVSDFQTEVSSFGSVADVTGEEDVETEPMSEGEMAPADLNGSNGDAPVEDGEAAAEMPKGRPRRRRNARHRPRLPIEQQLKRNQEIIVQVAKEPLGTKGARLTSFISLPGRHLVYTPTSNHIGISRRIESAEERARLRSAVRNWRRRRAGLSFARYARA